MTDPVSIMTMVGMASSAAGAGISARAARAEGDAKYAQYNYQAGMSEVNRQIALQNRDYSLNVGEREAIQYGFKAAQRKGEIAAGQGASGLDVGSQTSRDVRESQEKVTRMDMDTIRENAARVAYGYEVTAAQEKSQAGLYRMAAEDSRKAGKLKATASIIGGVSSVSDKWVQLGKTGMGPARTSPDPSPLIYGPGY